ncbi:MAG: sigma-70 family RNA polymerase sigma factor [Myxococcales bacterium]|nr:sigma-70 family RNA polymerase sigma factor [Myxococcales bacterium]
MTPYTVCTNRAKIRRAHMELSASGMGTAAMASPANSTTRCQSGARILVGLAKMSSLRQRLVEEHLYLADKAAKLIFRRVQHHIEWEELLALGHAGLTEAASRYDANAGASFSTYAWYRVQGAILDGLRRNSHVPATIWKQLAALRHAGDVLEAKAIEAALADKQDHAAASTLDTMRQLADALALVATSTSVSLDAPGGDDARFADPAAVDPAHKLDAASAASALAAAIAQLPEQQRVLLQKTYWEDMSLKEAGDTLGLSRSWASRLHLQALIRLRYVLAAYK